MQDSVKFIRRIFGQKSNSISSVDELVMNYLEVLPGCFKEVSIISPAYGVSFYTCEIVIPSERLIPWAVEHSESTRYTKEQSALMKALPIWLRGADKSLDRVSYLPAQIQRMIQSDVYRIIDELKIFCFECQSFVEVNMEKKDERRGGNTSEWTDVWTCPEGHGLYFEQHEAIFCK